jgi:hypothetical protein
MNRKEFLKKTCLSGAACMCGFSSIALFANNNENQQSTPEPDNSKLLLVQEWTNSLLSNLKEQLSEEELRRALKSCAVVHYNNLKMDKVLSQYIGQMDKFIKFLEGEWGWKVDYDKASKTLIANENKNYCVCPIVNHKAGAKPTAICYCSEGFAEKMFSTVAGVSAKATVISSIHRGDDRCKYKIVFA